MSNVRVNSNCMMCGGCLSLGYDFLEEQSDGHVKVKDNTYLKPDSAELKALMEVCPAQAFEYDKDAVIVSKEEQLMKIKQQLKMWKGIPEPTTKDIAFDERKYSMNMPYIRGSDFSNFEICPSSDLAYKMLAKGELVGDELVGSVHREFDSGSYSSLSSYSMYYDTDDMEVYEAQQAISAKINKL